MKKVLVINPRGIKGDEEYLHGMMSALYKRTDVKISLYTNYYYEIDNKDIPYDCHRFFFRRSEKMIPSTQRNFIRAVEYILQYKKMIGIIKKEKPDIVHIHWSIISKLDGYFFNRIKQHCGKLIYTAHNVLPHMNSDKYVESYRKIYQCADRVIVHGKNIFDEFVKIYPQYKDKVYISRHGKKNVVSDEIDYTDQEVIRYKEYFEKYEQIFLCIGMIYYEKGMDRVVNFWQQQQEHNNTCLVIAGKTQLRYKELDVQMEYMEKQEDLLFLNQYISNNLLNFFLKKANLIILPYRHASMSGVMLTAAAASVPVLCTDVGSLAEYITENCGWVVPNTDDKLNNLLAAILDKYTKEELKEVGERFNEYINMQYSWSTIVDAVVKDCY